ncbi:hypothetical protein MHLP_01790 [Candidatus Mycoplasma haematolamae str. Purdue]|uniref:Uncharacterized protein n=1 Tax=Mycoplasma haematolamae (strain Purdue) TaxID=1212765 RepID=I7BJD6_MYCHA|nr:hypothetical protein [Candidatus Mycoplasma haematolamae]AFO51938.1 hypothetical protein MHLP_01790 [Candidatus Mycoplasma haematolamae str. Purdue]
MLRFFLRKALPILGIGGGASTATYFFTTSTDLGIPYNFFGSDSGAGLQLVCSSDQSNFEFPVMSSSSYNIAKIKCSALENKVSSEEELRISDSSDESLKDLVCKSENRKDYTCSLKGRKVVASIDEKNTEITLEVKDQ